MTVTIAILAAALTSSPAPRPAQSDTAATTAWSAAAACASLTDADFTGVLDAPTQITGAKLLAAHGDVSEYCEVVGYVTPTVGFLLALPSEHWNGKFLELGCGGFCGGSLTGANEEKWGYFVGPLSHGYALLMFDGGHAVGGFSASWAYNNLEVQFDFGIRAPHVAALAGKAITEHYYNRALNKSYFCGCSTGGGQALSEAQRYPWDFDGIISGAPSPTFSGPMTYYLWAGRALAGTVNRADLQLLHDRAVAQCDMDDGIKDGVIGDPLHCNVDPAELLCKSGQTADCLTAAKVTAVKRVYSGPTTSKGERISTGGPLPGSELNWISDSDDPSGAYVYGSGAVAPWSGEYFSYVGFMPAPGPSWKPADFDFDRDYKRLRMAESLFGGADNPDLRKFKAAGGKLLMYQGGQDQSDIPTDAIDYYETAEKTMGGRVATQDFFRLFVIPGMDHCTGGAGPFAIDYLNYLETWVEQGRPPEMMLGAHVDDTYLAQRSEIDGHRYGARIGAYLLKLPLDPAIPVTFTRTIYPYPLRAKYRGTGDPRDAANFTPVKP